jgi:hypothetical protein
MGNLFLSFTIAISGAIGLVALSRVFDVDIYTSRIFPLIPILYAIIYEVLERRKTGKAKSIPPSKAAEEMKDGAKVIFQNITAGRIITDVGVSFAIKFSSEILLTALFIHFSGQTFTALYGAFGIETVGSFLRGEHPWLSGSEGLYILALLAVLTSIGTGLWIGYTSKGAAVLEGVLAGAAVTVVMAMTNMLILYRKIEEVSVRVADSMGYVMRAGFLVVIALQVLLYGLWSGLVRMGKDNRAELAAIKKSARKVKN